MRNIKVLQWVLQHSKLLQQVLQNIKVFLYLLQNVRVLQNIKVLQYYWTHPCLPYDIIVKLSSIERIVLVSIKSSSCV